LRPTFQGEPLTREQIEHRAKVIGTSAVLYTRNKMLKAHQFVASESE